jgi:hypothetical protein
MKNVGSQTLNSLYLAVTEIITRKNRLGMCLIAKNPENRQLFISNTRQIVNSAKPNTSVNNQLFGGNRVTSTCCIGRDGGSAQDNLLRGGMVAE